MDNEIYITFNNAVCDDVAVSTVTHKYAGGELNVKLSENLNLKGQECTVYARLQSSDDIMRLCLLTELLYTHGARRTKLIIPYFPYARQDRLTDKCTVFSLRPICFLINSLCFDEVVINDPHSDVVSALLNAVTIVKQEDFVKYNSIFYDVANVVIIAPDAGASKKASKVAEYHNIPLYIAQKTRDTSTGAITSLTFSGKIKGKTCVILDDICDGGATFVQLATKLKEQGAKKIILYVTHGIFSKGLDVFDNLIDEIWTTDSFKTKYTPDNLYETVFKVKG